MLLLGDQCMVTCGNIKIMEPSMQMRQISLLGALMAGLNDIYGTYERTQLRASSNAMARVGQICWSGALAVEHEAHNATQDNPLHLKNHEDPPLCHDLYCCYAASCFGTESCSFGGGFRRYKSCSFVG